MSHAEEWLDHLTRAGRSPGTIKAYRAALRAYSDDPLGVDTDEAEAWWREQDHLGVRTRARLLASVRSFYRWAIRYDLIERDPTRRLDAPSLPKGAPRYVTRN